MGKSDLIEEDLLVVYDTLWKQMQEDRKLILSSHGDLRALLTGSAERYAVNGDTLAKFSDILVKQTAQFVEVLKVLHKNKSTDESLSDLDLEKIKESIDE